MTNPHKGRTGVDRVLRAIGYSLQGLRAAIIGESAFRQESLAALALLAGTVLLVLIVELMNSAVEATVDRVSYEMHDLSKRAKDFGSAAVFLAILLCGGTWTAALYHHFTA